MFANRRSSQKPDEDFYAAFKQSFPEIGPGTTTSTTQPDASSLITHHGSTSVSEAMVESSIQPRYVSSSSSTLEQFFSPPLVLHVTQRSIMSRGSNSELHAAHHHTDTDDYFVRPYDHVVDDDNINSTTTVNVGKDSGTTPKPFADHWRLTPSLMDPTSLAFASFANQLPGYLTPTPSGFNTFYHSSAAGDLHTPGMGMNTPLSMPHSLHGLPVADNGMHYHQHFNPHLLHPHQAFHDMFQHQQPPHTQQLQQQSHFAPPSHFVHQDSGYAGMSDTSKNNTPRQEGDRQQQGLVPPPMHQHDSGVSMAVHAGGEKFRFHTTLNAPTAMVKSTDEIPVTYLNKGQAYTMSIFDANAPAHTATSPTRYRTYVRVSFEDEQQRAKPGACWQLWREGRGSNEAHQRGGRLLAVEYVDPNQGGVDDFRKSQVELEKASFDGFVVTWTPQIRTTESADCSLSVRFNFLSTDFSHSKGVKGIPVRLCAKTEILTDAPGSSINEAEVCFAKVKLFRDHGAERKLSNDVAHVKKSIEKLKQQISQAEAGIGNVGKRKRSGSTAKQNIARVKMNKHKRGWSADSDVDVVRLTAEEDMHLKLIGLQDMFSSTRPLSVLYLKGDPEDDPDRYPVEITGSDGLSKPLSRTQTWDSKASGEESPNSEIISPVVSSASITPKRKYSEMQQTSILEEDEEDEGDESGSAVRVRSVSRERPTKLVKRDHSNAPDDLLALDVDSEYQAPAEQGVRPGESCRRLWWLTGTNIETVACFYVKEKDSHKSYYRAVYLWSRTVADLTNCIAVKFQIEPSRITRVTHVNSKGLQIVVDEDVVRELPEGQDMMVEFAPARPEYTPKHDMISTKELFPDADDQAPDTTTDYLEMWLNY